MSEPTAFDDTVVDDLNVHDALAALGIDVDELDRELAASEQSGLPAGLWDPMPGFEERVQTRVAQRLRDREAAWMLAELAGLAWSTLRVVIDDEPGDVTW